VSSVLGRASRILELLAAEGGRAWSVGEVAEALELPPTTCHRLLGELVQLGWVDQRGRRQGYSLGPRVFALSSGEPYRAELMQRVRGPAARLAERLERQVVVAGLRNAARQTLVAYGPGGLPLRVPQLMETNDMYSTSGGRLLLALLPAFQRRRVIDCLGLPGRRQWPGVIDRRELRDELAVLRRQRWCCIDRPNGKVTMSAAFQDPPAGWVAIGCYGPKRGFDESAAALVRSVAAELHRSA